MESDVSELVASAIFGAGPDDLLEDAARIARTPRERQLVVIAGAFRRGDHALVDVLAREHLADHPDSVLVARIASAAKESKEIS